MHLSRSVKKPALIILAFASILLAVFTLVFSYRELIGTHHPWPADRQAELVEGSPIDKVVRQEIADGQIVEYLIPPHTSSLEIQDQGSAYAWAWDNGNLKFGWQNNGQTEIEEFTDFGQDVNNAEYKHVSELYFDQGSNSKLNLSAENVTNLKLIIYKDRDPREANGNGIGGAGTGGQVNLASGANYSELGIITRAAWGADESKATWKPGYMRFRKVVVHHTAMATHPADYAQSVRMVFLYHAITMGWGDIGYNYLIAPNGAIYEGRKGGADVIGAHAYGNNGGGLGVAILGNYSSVVPSGAAQNSLKKLLVEKSLLHGFRLVWHTNVFGHRDVTTAATACPGTAFYNILPTLIQQAETTRTTLHPTSKLSTTRAASIATLTGYTDVRLRLTFKPEAIAEVSSVDKLLPVNSGIFRVSNVTASSVDIAIEANPYYMDMYREETDSRVLNLHTIFSLDPRVEQIDLIDNFEALYKLPTVNGQIDIEVFKPTIYFSYPVTRRTGQIEIVDAQTNTTHEIFDINSSAVAMPSTRKIVVTPTKQLVESKSYYIKVCPECIESTTGIDYAGVTGTEWPITAKVTNFKPVYRFWSSKLGSHYYTMSESEKTKIQTQLSHVWQYNGIAFSALSTADCHKGKPVHLFWSDRMQAHFYTIKTSEKDKLINTMKNIWGYTGVKFCAYDYQRVGTRPVYRFWSDVFQNHFYTASESEKNKLITLYGTTNPSIWRYNGIAFYVK